MSGQTLPWTPFPAFGNGPPTVPATFGRVWYDMSTTPWTPYVARNGVWTQSGQGGSAGGVVTSGSAKIALTNAQLTHLHSAPVQLVAAPGAGKILVPTMIIGDLTFGTAAFAAATPNIFWGTNAGTSAIGSQAALQAWLRAGANEGLIDDAVASGAIQAALANFANLRLILGDAGADDATGDSTAELILTYNIVTL